MSFTCDMHACIALISILMTQLALQHGKFFCVGCVQKYKLGFAALSVTVLHSCSHRNKASMVHSLPMYCCFHCFNLSMAVKTTVLFSCLLLYNYMYPFTAVKGNWLYCYMGYVNRQQHQSFTDEVVGYKKPM